MADMIRPQMTDEVAEALLTGRPVVALESTIISHGMPWPRNAEVAMSVEESVREEGAVPATIAVIDGVCCAGLSAAQVERLGRDARVVKAASRDLGSCLVKGLTAGTTVSATMRIAALAGIGVFATGGIGGVHRGDDLDVSADLTELAKTDVTVVCAGVKSILDIPRTIEVLETLRVPVVTYGADEFPAFYTPHSGVVAGDRVDDPAQIAAIRAANQQLGLGTGMLVANPIPATAALEAQEIAATIDAALDEAKQQGVTGKDVTPFLLGRLNETTDGTALAANIALVLNNATLAARIAVAGAKGGAWV
ncbi:pseudouridine-5'-phosphate glycosidase [Jannaschia pagri]|uniref:Pseudouridine-5'-phosphate glycosidase n=2 Tax=Roseobacteraceae TaxID=2854170 RepID=A0ABQ4NI30_9RHOB|nr:MULTISPECIES: pseudouridine-5'-phosphate glycosidase [unclassified Jannaschia]GIT89819.1 pseudouridine-5'-phosphate glycosidase [Jannaschia sp. AI_61]GIT94074.1 pseudouridine-5'-phosphate glycosidase [Jannaschia sp. AI_62]